MAERRKQSIAESITTPHSSDIYDVANVSCSTPLLGALGAFHRILHISHAQILRSSHTSVRKADRAPLINPHSRS